MVQIQGAIRALFDPENIEDFTVLSAATPFPLPPLPRRHRLQIGPQAFLGF